MAGQAQFVATLMSVIRQAVSKEVGSNVLNPRLLINKKPQAILDVDPGDELMFLSEDDIPELDEPLQEDLAELEVFRAYRYPDDLTQK